MKLTDYPFQVKKSIAVLLHIIFLTLAVAGISFIYLNSQVGNGITWVLDRNYEDSEQFQKQVEKDINLIFKYIAYRDVFETAGQLDLSSEMFSVSRNGGSEITYTLEEVLRYAKSQGFYINDNFEVVNDLFIYDSASTTKDQRVNWRAYDPNATISEPGEAYTSLLDLTKEVLDCLSQYYYVYNRMIKNPSNLYFRVSYGTIRSDQILYSNTDASIEELRALGKYCYLDSDSIFIDTNLNAIPENLTASLENSNLYDADDYRFAVAVDTNYYVDDLYAEEANKQQELRHHFIEGLGFLSIGILGCLATLYYLFIASGYNSSKQTEPTLHAFDTISAEACVLLTAIITLFGLFLGEKVGYKLLHLLISESSWSFAERMLRAIIIYTCCILGLFSLLRRYKCRQLWKSSTICHIRQTLGEYFIDHSFSHRLFCLYASFVGSQLACTALIALCIHLFAYPAAKLGILILIITLLVINYFAYHKLFLTAKQEDSLSDAVSRIAGGDTSYQMDLSQLSGKELEIGHMINNIGIVMERALKEQVKSERFKADLITNVSHDIKTPLTSIINYVDLLKRENIQNSKIQEYLNILEQKSQRLKNLTEDLVEASKASSGNLKLEMSTIDLVEMIWQTHGEFEEKFATRHLELLASLPDNAILIEADGRRLWRILENLYNNAFKYSMEHSRIYTELLEENDMVFFTIKNVSEHPLNISSEELTERFVRGDVSRSTEGSGLGLSIAESLTKLQGGTFRIEIDGDLFKAIVGFPIKKKS